MAKLEYQEKDGKVFCPLKNKWLVAKPEEKVRQRYICMLVNEYGYSTDALLGSYGIHAGSTCREAGIF